MLRVTDALSRDFAHVLFTTMMAMMQTYEKEENSPQSASEYFEMIKSTLAQQIKRLLEEVSVE